jgi:hypothetical protein
LLFETTKELLEGAGVQDEAPARQVVQAVTSRFSQQWSEKGGWASDPDREFSCLPSFCHQQLRLVIKEIMPSVQLEEEGGAYGSDSDDDSLLLPLPPTSSPSLSPSFPPALPPLIGGGPGRQ